MRARRGVTGAPLTRLDAVRELYWFTNVGPLSAAAVHGSHLGPSAEPQTEPGRLAGQGSWAPAGPLPQATSAETRLKCSPLIRLSSRCLLLKGWGMALITTVY